MRKKKRERGVEVTGGCKWGHAQVIKYWQRGVVWYVRSMGEEAKSDKR